MELKNNLKFKDFNREVVYKELRTDEGPAGYFLPSIIYENIGAPVTVRYYDY